MNYSKQIEGAGDEKNLFPSASIDVPSPFLPVPAVESRKRSQSVSAIDADRSLKIIFHDKALRDDNSYGQEEFPIYDVSNPCTPTRSLKIFFHDKAVIGDSSRANFPKYSDSIPSTQTKHERTFSKCMHVSISSPNKFSRLPRHELSEKSYNSFKTWAGKLDKTAPDDPQVREGDSLPTVNRYFDALEGPDLDTLRSSEELVLPEDKQWPFLLRFPISTFGMCLGVGSQAMLWKTLATAPTMSFMNISPKINLFLWYTAVALFSLVSFIYALKIIFYFEAVRREYYHPVRINFFFAPWIACLFLAIALPQHVAKGIHKAVWYALMAPIFFLELKIYGQWMSGGERRLSKVANPCNHLAVVGNFVGALLGASMGLKEGPIFFFAVGVAHYTVLFVTLYQRLPTNERLPKELHPVFFLFIAAPSVACTSWATITGGFGIGARIPYFIAMFLYASLAVRVNFFRGFRFSLTWWAYTFPMAGSAIATIRYTAEVNSVNTKTLALSLAIISTFTVSVLLISTVLHCFVFHNLFPNDIAIAISHKKSKYRNKRQRCHPPDGPDLEACEYPSRALIEVDGIYRRRISLRCTTSFFSLVLTTTASFSRASVRAKDSAMIISRKIACLLVSHFSPGRPPCSPSP